MVWRSCWHGVESTSRWEFVFMIFMGHYGVHIGHQKVVCVLLAKE
jgi:hypothetical protein